MYLYIKALHIIFIVNWFSGMFYIVRLFIYNTEANEKTEPERTILQRQFGIMMRRLWFGITWPSALLTLFFGPGLVLFSVTISTWLWIKLGLVAGLYLYHLSLHILYKQQQRGIFNYTSQQLRLWNEVATLFLVGLVFLVVVKQGISLFWGVVGLLILSLLLMSVIKVYRLIRLRK
jgi:putative membrane protein